MNKNTVLHRELALVLVGSVATLLILQPAQAVVSTWKSGPSSANWSDAGSWDTTPVTNNSLTFGTSPTTTLNNDLTTGPAWVIPSIREHCQIRHGHCDLYFDRQLQHGNSDRQWRQTGNERHMGRNRGSRSAAAGDVVSGSLGGSASVSGSLGSIVSVESGLINNAGHDHLGRHCARAGFGGCAKHQCWRHLGSRQDDRRNSTSRHLDCQRQRHFCRQHHKLQPPVESDYQ